MRNFKLLFLIAVSFVLLFSSCKKSTEPESSVNTQSSTDNAMIDGEFSAIFSMATAQSDVSNTTEFERKANHLEGNNAKCDQLPSCATVTVDSIMKQITIDFGSTNCLCKDNLTRRGKIIITVTGKWKTVGSSIAISLDNYYVQDMKVTGTKTISILAENSFNVVVSNASLTTPTGVISWNANRTITQTKGFLTKLIGLDDEFVISGNASGINRQGVGFSVAIENNYPLIKRVSCTLKDFVSGIVTIQNDKGDKLSVNYNPDGQESCDKNAAVTINGKLYAIKLR